MPTTSIHFVSATPRPSVQGAKTIGMPQHPSVDRLSSTRLKSMACAYCREKKLKCDGNKPTCHNCRKRGIECIPNALVQRSRPTNSKIQQLEEETRRLREELYRSRQVLGGLASQGVQDEEAQQNCYTAYPRWVHDGRELASSCGGHGQEEQISPENDETMMDDPAMVTQPARVLAPCVAESPKNHQPNYHGPTSALFDETSQPHESLSAEDCAPSADVPGTQCSLVAETSKQRQLEAINFSSNLLDFDGIEPELGMQLLSLYWSRQLHAGLAVYRPAFMRDMACGGPYFSKLLLNAMYYSVSKHSSCLSIRRDITDRDSAGWSFRQRFRELLRDEFDKSKITTIQALLIMASSLFTRCDERSTSWLYAGNAFNMVTDMGLHATSSYCRKTSAEESEIHRRVFWSAYMIDKIQCLYQGRHPSLRIVDTDTALIFADDYEELERFDHVSFCDPKHSAPSYTISMFKALCELSVIMERIHSKIYAVSYLTKPFDDGISDSRSLYSDLKAWRKNLLPHLDFMASSSQNNPLPYNLSMLAVYNVLVILTHRLLLSDKGSVSSSPTQNTEALNACMTAANEITKILQVYEGLYNPSSATFALSYATYISAKVHLHVLAYPGSHTSTLDSLRICLKALDQQQHLYSASIRAMAMTKKLMTRTGVNADEHARSSLTDESLQTTRDASIPQNSQANVENLDFPNLESGLPENLGNTIGMEQVWLNATQFMAFDDLYYNDVSRTTNSATLLYHASNAQGGELSYGV